MAEWTCEPPDAPGFYWARHKWGIPEQWQEPEIIQYMCNGAWLSPGEDRTLYFKGDDKMQFWPERIEPPKG